MATPTFAHLEHPRMVAYVAINLNVKEFKRKLERAGYPKGHEAFQNIGAKPMRCVKHREKPRGLKFSHSLRKGETAVVFQFPNGNLRAGKLALEAVVPELADAAGAQ